MKNFTAQSNISVDSLGFVFGINEGLAEATKLEVLPFLGDTIDAEFAVVGRFEKSSGTLRLTAHLVDQKEQDTTALGVYPVDALAFDATSINAQKEIIENVVQRLHYGISLPTWLVRYKKTYASRSEWLLQEGRGRLKQWSIGSLLVAHSLFSRVLKEDSTSAEGHAGVAYASALLGLIGGEPQTHYANAERASEAALASNPYIAEALLAQGIVRLYRDMKVSQARVSFREASVRHPRDAAVHYWYGKYLTVIGDSAGARREFVQSQRLQPGFLPALVGLGEAEFYAGAFRQAELTLEPVVFREPCQINGSAQYPVPTAYHYLGRTLFSQQRMEDAEQVFELAIARCQRISSDSTVGKPAAKILGVSVDPQRECAPRHRSWEVLRAQALAAQGEVVTADSIVDCVKIMYPGNPPLYELAAYYATHPRTTARDSALDLLDNAIKEHLRNTDIEAVLYWRVDPVFQPLMASQKARSLVGKYRRTR